MAQWMVMGNIRYAFLTSSDEVIFLKFDVTERVKYVNMADPGGQPEFDPVDLYKEPWIGFSRPIKFTDVLDEAKGTVPVRLAMVYLLQTSLTSTWRIVDDLGSSSM